LAVVVSAVGVGVGRGRIPAETSAGGSGVTFDELMKPAADDELLY
jgi:hypothetical protein